MSDRLDLKKYIRTVKDFPIDGIVFRDITSLIETPEAFIKTCDELTRITKEFGANIVASIESRGFIFAGTIARDNQNTNFRKSAQKTLWSIWIALIGIIGKMIFWN